MVVDFEEIKTEGWELVASIDLDENGIGQVINKAPSVYELTLPAELRSQPGYCDHCNKYRKRNKVYIFRSGDPDDIIQEFRQVGSNCASDFLGGIDPASILSRYEVDNGIADLLEQAQNPGFFGISSQSDYVDLMTYMSFAHFVIKKLGWVSRAKARDDYGVTATADIVSSALNGSSEYRDLINEYNAVDQSENEKNCEAVLEWARNLDVSEADSDYLYNLTNVVRHNYISRKHVGIAVSIFSAYGFAVASQLPKDEGFPIGEVGKRLITTLKVVDIKYWPAYGGGTAPVYFMETADGAKVVWKASRAQPLNVGDSIYCSFKVKQHKQFNGIWQTHVTHLKREEDLL